MFDPFSVVVDANRGVEIAWDLVGVGESRDGNPERANFIAEARPIPLEVPVTTTALGRPMDVLGSRDLLQIMPFSFQ